MAKINKYWGLVAVGALTAAATGAIAAIISENLYVKTILKMTSMISMILKRTRRKKKKKRKKSSRTGTKPHLRL